MKKWNVKADRFVLFMDILGFKELVLKNSHEDIYAKLNILKEFSQKLDNSENWIKETQIESDQTRTVTFSDSLIVFSKGNTIGDAHKIIVQAIGITRTAFKHNIPIKGAISFGQISVDFEKSVFFGQPIIDAYLLHEDLKQLSVILDHNSENQIELVRINPSLKKYLLDFNAFLSYGRAKHKLVFHPNNDDFSLEHSIESLYKLTSGKPRLYIDNTKVFLNSKNVNPN